MREKREGKMEWKEGGKEMERREGSGVEWSGSKWVEGGEVSDGSAWMEWKEVEGGENLSVETRRKRGGERQSCGGKYRK